MLLLLLLIPLASAALALAIAADTPRRLILTLAAAAHLALTVAAFAAPPAAALGGLLDLDPLGHLFLAATSLLFLAASVYAVGYLRAEGKGQRRDFQEGAAFSNAPERIFTACLLVFLAAMTLVACTRNLGALWVGVEGTTLASAPLIYFHRHRRSLEATWKYLLICSVGIALALLGNILLSVAFYDPAAASTSMNLTDLAARAHVAQAPWLKAAFICILVGYGVKMGLAPMHNWLPDAHSQSPSLVSALLSGALLNCAFLGILRAHQICVLTGLEAFSQELLTIFGLISMATAAAFIVGQGDYKRLLAYSSVEHMGLLALSVGVGGGAVFGGMLHLLGHSLTKGMLFLVSGNILALYRTRSCHDTRGMARAMPITAALWTAGFLAIAGSPPFGLFVSEFSVLSAMIRQGHTAIACATLTSLAVIFVGMSVPVLRMVQGPRPPAVTGEAREDFFAVAPPLALCALVLMLGLYLPESLIVILTRAAGVVVKGL
ncbi:MAG: NADH dehydrogenase FAD-containing subunit [Desulfovibrionaceae bacterium]|nr:NADH dehydrogenase FAD-containing subunit [Desulfovibrionaceae bacterium]